MSSWDIQALIDEKEGEIARSQAHLDSLEDELLGVRGYISTLEGELKVLTSEAVDEKAHVQSLIARSHSNQSEILGPEWVSPGTANIATAFNEAIGFAYSQLARLESALNANQSDKEPFELPLPQNFIPSADGLLLSDMQDQPSISAESPYDSFEPMLPGSLGASSFSPIASIQEYEEGSASVLCYANGVFSAFDTPKVGQISVVLDTTYDYEVGAKTGSVPYKVYAIPACDWTNDKGSAERFGVEVTAAMLAAEGRRAIVSLGGPGKPDLISLDAMGRIWMTEVKGSFKGRPLYKSGLLRDVRELSELYEDRPDPLGGRERVWENSPDWLRRSGPDVLRVLKQIEAATEDSKIKADVKELTLRYAEAVSAGFDKNSHTTEIFQVASLADDQGAPYLDPNPTVHAYCAEVEPARITQVDVE